MNIYNKLFILEYTRIPFKSCNSKMWSLNLSKRKYWYYHRNFNLTAIIYKYSKYNRIVFKYRFNKQYNLKCSTMIFIKDYRENKILLFK